LKIKPNTRIIDGITGKIDDLTSIDTRELIGKYVKARIRFNGFILTNNKYMSPIIDSVETLEITHFPKFTEVMIES
jgi:hypothetical protein